MIFIDPFRFILNLKYLFLPEDRKIYIYDVFLTMCISEWQWFSYNIYITDQNYRCIKITDCVWGININRSAGIRYIELKTMLDLLIYP